MSSTTMSLTTLAQATHHLVQGKALSGSEQMPVLCAPPSYFFGRGTQELDEGLRTRLPAELTRWN